MNIHNSFKGNTVIYEKNKLIILNIDEIIQNTYSTLILFLRVIINNEFRPDLSYHLHFLHSVIKNNNIIICLNTGNFLSGRKKEVSLMIQKLCIDFIKYVFDCINKNKEHIVLDKSVTKFWDKFDEVRRSSKKYNNKYFNIDMIEITDLLKKNKLLIRGEVLQYNVINS